MKKVLLIVAIGLAVFSSRAQITGEVFPEGNHEQGNGLPGANVYWEGANTGTSTDTTGAFVILPPARLPANLIISFIGFKADTIKILKPEESIYVALKSTGNMDEFVVEERKQSTSYNMMSIRQVEQLDASELSRAACCNISEAFETNASVDVVSSDGVTGAKKIQMLGLDGIYTSLQFENIPLVRGLANLDGLSHIPGTWVQSIQISKGSGSVVNGYEGMTGQINLEFLKPDDLNEKIFINLYGNVMGRAEINAHIGDKINKKWSTLFLAHANMNQIPLDNNNDGFMDVTLKKQINLFNRWKYKGEHYRAQFGVRGIVEEKTGGVMDFDPETDFGTTNRYGVGATGNHLEGFYKSGIVFDKRPWRSVAIITRGSYHDQTLYAGLMNYEGNETYFYSNLIFSDIIKTTEHKYKIGASYVFDDYDETFNGKNYVRTEHVPGLFGEYTYARDKFQTILGARSDFHNLYGTQLSPKVNFKYEFSERGAARVSMGRGFRVANIFVDNNSTFVSQRVISIQNNLLPEVAWNTGISATQKVEIAERYTESISTLNSKTKWL
jgi:outer membrane receptor for ferrienterochelin and colicins